MPSKPAAHLKPATWRLDRDLLAAVQAACAQRREPVVTFVTRALTRELEDPSGHRLPDDEFDEFIAAVRSCRGTDPFQ